MSLSQKLSRSRYLLPFMADFERRPIDKQSKASKLEKKKKVISATRFFSFKLHFKKYLMPPPKYIFICIVFDYKGENAL